MLHSFVRVYIHLVWGVKYRQKLLAGDIGAQVEAHIVEYARSRGILVDRLSVQPEHVHALIELRSDQKIEDIVHLLKGESSHWINESNLMLHRFSWQRGYGAFAVSERESYRVRAYISSQADHHRRKAFAEEVQEVLAASGFAVSETDESVAV